MTPPPPISPLFPPPPLSPSPLPDRHPPHRVCQAVRLVGQGPAGRRANAARGDVDRGAARLHRVQRQADQRRRVAHRDRKSTRLNSSHLVISYAVFCLKKKNK